MWNLYENPWPALTAGMLTLAVGAGLGRNGINRSGRALVVAGLLICLGGVGLERLVRTDSEQIRNLLYSCRRAATAADVGAFDKWICPDYRDSVHSGKEQLLAFIRQVVGAGGVDRVKFRSIELSVNGSQASTRLNIRIQTNVKNPYIGGGLFFVGLNVIYRKDSQLGWRIISVELQSINDQRMLWKNI